jgi:hypothetical protein
MARDLSRHYGSGWQALRLPLTSAVEWSAPDNLELRFQNVLVIDAWKPSRHRSA